MSQDTFEITGNDRFKAKASAVFAFDQVTLKTAGDAASSTPSTPDNPPSLTHESESDTLQTDDFKGRESLFRVPENEWDNGPKDRRPKEHFAEDLRRVLERRQKSSSSGRSNSPPPRETFRRPPNPKMPRNRHHRVPDFKKNPDKYKKYSLKDVDLTSNRGNTQAAFAFLQEIQDRKRKMEPSQEEENEEDRRMKESGQIQFKPRTSSSSKSGQQSTSGSKSRANEKKIMRLSHLMEDEEDED